MNNLKMLHIIFYSTKYNVVYYLISNPLGFEHLIDFIQASGHVTFIGSLLVICDCDGQCSDRVFNNIFFIH